jgi:hypothetical protein
MTERQQRVCIALGLMFLPLFWLAGGSLCVFVQHGPLAWNGVIAFWLLAIAFFIWMVTMSLTMLRASRRAERDGAELALAA